MKQTAVDWLAEKYNYVTWLRNRDEVSAEQGDRLRKIYLEKAKQMEKEQIEDAIIKGEENIDMDGCYENPNLSEQYYNQTFNQNK